MSTNWSTHRPRQHGKEVTEASFQILPNGLSVTGLSCGSFAPLPCSQGKAGPIEISPEHASAPQGLLFAAPHRLEIAYEGPRQTRVATRMNASGCRSASVR